MELTIYIKNTENIAEFGSVIDTIRQIYSDLEINVISESRRSFRALDACIEKASIDDIILALDIKSLGLNETDVAVRLEAIISSSTLFVICHEESTYEFGVSQPLNKAVLKSILKRIVPERKNIIEMPLNRLSNRGRNKAAYPDNWEELYEMWDNKEISSKEFIEKSGLKKATFYKLLTEYRDQISRIREIKTHYNV